MVERSRRRLTRQCGRNVAGSALSILPPRVSPPPAGPQPPLDGGRLGHLRFEDGGHAATVLRQGPSAPDRRARTCRGDLSTGRDGAGTRGGWRNIGAAVGLAYRGRGSARLEGAAEP